MISVLLTAVLLIGESPPASVPQDSLAIHQLILESLASRTPDKALLLDRRILVILDESYWSHRFRSERAESYIQQLIDLDLVQGVSIPTPIESKPTEIWRCFGTLDTTAVSIGQIKYEGDNRAECLIYMSGVTYDKSAREDWTKHNPYINLNRYVFERGESGWIIVESTWELEISLAPKPPPEELARSVEHH